jgi:methyl halide transferase
LKYCCNEQGKLPVTPNQKHMNDIAPLDGNYWNKRYQAGETGWDMGMVSPPIKAYIDQLTDKQIRILIPGCGNSYEAAYLLQCGFDNVTLIDIAPVLVQQLQKQFDGVQGITVLCGDFFEHIGQYDLILEQTFFCALHPAARPAYAAKMMKLLRPGGKLVGLLFNRQFETEGPPFGGEREEYLRIFSPFFDAVVVEDCYNSHAKRAGNELFVILVPKA